MEQSKKELELNGIQAAEFLIESGDDVLPRYIEISRQIALLEAEKKTLKEAAFDERVLFGSDPVTIAGCKISISNTGDRIQYDKDPIIQERKRLLKTANLSSGKIFDNDGVEVEKVPITYGSDVIKIQF